jgi:hypothetical protein
LGNIGDEPKACGGNTQESSTCAAPDGWNGKKGGLGVEGRGRGGGSDVWPVVLTAEAGWRGWVL